jgi:hypothetical protein
VCPVDSEPPNARNPVHTPVASPGNGALTVPASTPARPRVQEAPSASASPLRPGPKACASSTTRCASLARSEIARMVRLRILRSCGGGFTSQQANRRPRPRPIRKRPSMTNESGRACFLAACDRPGVVEAAATVVFPDGTVSLPYFLSEQHAELLDRLASNSVFPTDASSDVWRAPRQQSGFEFTARH